MDLSATHAAASLGRSRRTSRASSHAPAPPREKEGRVTFLVGQGPGSPRIPTRAGAGTAHSECKGRCREVSTPPLPGRLGGFGYRGVGEGGFGYRWGRGGWTHLCREGGDVGEIWGSMEPQRGP